MSEPLILTESAGHGITVLTLNRPERRNALSTPLMEKLCETLTHLNESATQRVLILEGAGSVFCAGLDLKEASTTTDAHRSAELVAKMLEAVATSPLVTIAAVHGAAIAGGAGLMSACDFVVAGEHAKIGYPEVHRGLVAGLVMTFLRRQLRERDARELLLLGELIDATRAKEIGLVNQVVPDIDVHTEAVRLAERALKGAPGAIARSKQLLAELWSRKVREDLELALDYHLRARGSLEAAEGMAAFLEKRSPRWPARQ
ncbi:MAG: enoyl-CoA hydratase/isomerase family protein [Planctomycetota bacterium]